MSIKNIINDNRNMLRVLFLVCVCLLSSFSFAQKTEYVVIAGKNVKSDPAWLNVAQTLVKEHHAALLSYTDNLNELLVQLRSIKPRYVAIVEKPENVGRDYVIALNQLSRKIDNDIYADFLWGIITGYDADAAMRMVKNDVKPFVVKDAIATVAELKSAKWFNRFAYIDDHVKGAWGEKTSSTDTVKISNFLQSGKNPAALSMQKFYDIYSQYDPDLIVTASHASQRNLEMPYSLGNVKAHEGRLYMDLPGSPEYLPKADKRRVFLPIGNCLIGDVNNTRESMAIAWMNSGNAAAMVGYVVTTWFGRNGWGGLKYWLTTPGRYSLSEAVFLNQQDIMNQLNNYSPKLTTAVYPAYEGREFESATKLVADIMGKQPNKDEIGLLHDRDVVVYYGDPKWNVRLQEIPAENDFTVTSKIKGNKCVITIVTKDNFSLERMQGNKFKMEHVLDLPFSYFFPKRLNNPRLAQGQDYNIALDENFLLLYNPKFEPNHTYQIVLDIDK